MSLVIQYLLKLSISLAVVYLFYYFLLRRLTFYNSNRWYLLLYSFCSFLIPFINIYPVLEKNQLEGSGIVNYIPAVSNRITINDPVIRSTLAYEDARVAGTWLMIILLAGGLVMLVKLILQYISFLKVKKSSKLIINDPIKVFQVNDAIIPFSIGNSIFINQHLHSDEELREIIRHEFIHVKEKHSVDIFLGEILCVLNWYNPFAWLIRRAIRVNLEFIADHKVLESGMDRKEYQYLLLKVIGIPQFSITTQFNFSSLKKRIAMMNKKQSTKSQLLKLLLLLPILIVVLLAFRSKNMPWNPVQMSANYLTDTVPVPPAPPKAPVPTGQIGEGKEYEDFLKRNPGVRSLELKTDLLVVHLKNNGIETYDLANESRYEAAVKKYGKLPLQMPAPPAPPVPPVKTALPKDVKQITITETKATVVLSNGKREEFDLTKVEELEAFQEKYRSIEPHASLEKMGHELELMELKARQAELNHLRMEKEMEFELLRKEQEGEIHKQNERRELDMKTMLMQKEKEMELFHKKFQLEAERQEEMRRKEFEKASKEKGADVNKLKVEYESDRNQEMAKRHMELLKASKEKEIEMEMLQKKFELDARRELNLRQEDLEEKQHEMHGLLQELHERNELLQHQLELDAKSLLPERKKEAISQLEVQKKELSRLMQELKSKEMQINKQLQELKKKDR